MDVCFYTSSPSASFTSAFSMDTVNHDTSICKKENQIKKNNMVALSVMTENIRLCKQMTIVGWWTAYASKILTIVNVKPICEEHPHF